MKFPILFLNSLLLKTNRKIKNNMKINMQCLNEKKVIAFDNPSKFPTSDNFEVFSIITMYNSAKKVNTSVIRLNLKTSPYLKLLI